MPECTEEENAALLHDSRADLHGGETDHAVNQAHDVRAQIAEELQLHVWLQLLHHHPRIHEMQQAHDESTWRKRSETSSSSVQHHPEVVPLKAWAVGYA